MEPMDLLFVPAGTPHQVRNSGAADEVTVAISGNVILPPNLALARRELEAAGTAGDSRARELAEQLGAATFDESFDEDATDLPFAQFKRGGKLEGRSE